MKKHKVQVVEGVGALASAGKLIVTKGDKTTELTAKHILVATGARARELPFAKADGKRVWTYRHAMVPEEMPTSCWWSARARSVSSSRASTTTWGRR